ncbi:hypothetical protein M5X00_27210 [Paenibacillus alvei]|uniref:Uncharacterized protein n=1 Tax=Paenibacillus alvei TaxID=44250 RepID=A0ABT4GU39_PAEAL|nr:hypothetical protein [Paenibacillus alvei]EJW17797.1 hypothetical protein PAV_3c02450 [Paenibacillus alvei DSM 29]MCY9544588.1 hypothetical protein [Paenibacillus alvei]MCY9708110.1 hypothetical protein [Paenibacillus alvei]MCY9737405.1 hypothetical protein [Paenibacillus alvei]MCY9757919.1 hypothetical protein [Paenibacillus alvei]
MKKKWIVSLLSVSMAFSMFAPMALAASVPEQQAESQKQGHMLQIGKDEFSKKVLNAISVMDRYITVSKDQFVIDPAAKNVVGADIYEHYKKGIDSLNAEVRQGTIVIQNGQVSVSERYSTNAFSNTYWWGVAITFSDSETKAHALAMRQSGNTTSFLAAIAAFIPGGWLAAVTGAAWGWAANSIANDFDYYNRGNGATLNIHWLPVIYYEVTSN